MKGKNINFIRASKIISRKQRHTKDYQAGLFLLPVLIIVFFGYDYYSHQLLLRKYQEIQVVQIQEHSFADLNLQTNVHINEMVEKKNLLDTIPDFTKEYFVVLNELMSEGMRIVIDQEHVFEFQQGMVQLTVAADNYQEIPLYLERLEKVPFFIAIEYTGFQRVEDEYFFRLGCKVGEYR